MEALAQAHCNVTQHKTCYVLIFNVFATLQHLITTHTRSNVVIVVTIFVIRQLFFKKKCYMAAIQLMAFFVLLAIVLVQTQLFGLQLQVFAVCLKIKIKNKKN